MSTIVASPKAGLNKLEQEFWPWPPPRGTIIRILWGIDKGLLCTIEYTAPPSGNPEYDIGVMTIHGGLGYLRSDRQGVDWERVWRE